MTEYVVGFIFHPTKGVLLIKKNRPDWQRGKLTGIGGHIEPNEAPLDAMRRECFEETGLSIESWEKIVELRHTERIVHFFNTGLYPELEPSQTTDESLIWVQLGNLYEHKTIWNLQWLIPLCFDTSVKFPITIEDGVA